MRKYNYFDDEPEEIEKDKKILPHIDFDLVLEKIKSGLSWLASGEILDDIRELRTMPNLKRAVLKLTAFAVFLIFVILFIIIFTATINSQNNKTELFLADAGKVCTDYMTKYGPIKSEPMKIDSSDDELFMLTGLCYARQMDFDNDGDAELMVVYNNKNVYTLEVWSYVKNDFTKVYSQKANSTNDLADGSWIGLYRKSNKYYICKSEKDEPEKVVFYALKGNSFKKDSSCDYDYKNNIYSIDGKINASDFETIKFSAIKSSRAEAITDTVTEKLSALSSISAASLEKSKTPQELKNDAYYEIVEKRNNAYGKASEETENGVTYIDGLAVVRLVDFNKDGNEELLLVYRKMVKKSSTDYYSGQNIIIEEPAYCMEVYDWNGTVARKIFSRDNISNLMGHTDTNFLMLRSTDSGYDICVNYYTYKSDYTYTASSRIYRMEEDSKFGTIFSARVESEYGWKQYYIDNEYTYQSTFEDKAYEVPLFLNDSGSYGDEYSVTYLSTEQDEKELDGVIDDTVKTIETLNQNYIADE